MLFTTRKRDHGSESLPVQQDHITEQTDSPDLDLRDAERKVYRNIYDTEPGYVCKGRRLPQTEEAILAIPIRGSYLDVGCGTNQMLRFARRCGFYPVVGVDHVATNGTAAVAAVHALPFKDQSFDVVVMMDVIEHLVPGDDYLACKELQRVARKYILVSAQNKPSIWKGRDLHINKRDYGEWDKLFRKWFGERCKLKPGRFTSPIWRVLK